MSDLEVLKCASIGVELKQMFKTTFNFAYYQ